MAISYQVSIPQLPALQAAFAKAPEVSRSEISNAVNRSLLAYQTTAKQLAPVDTGQLRSSIQMFPAQWSGTTISGSVGTNKDYAEIQEAGSGIYGPSGTPITPKSKKALARYSNGQWHFAASVKGVRPRWYMRGSLEQNEANTDQNFQAALDTIANSLAVGGAV